MRARGLQSLCKKTRDEILQFDVVAFRELRKIAGQLRQNRFEFTPQHGILVRRSAKRPRPIVIGSVRNRVVQRAILDVLQADQNIANVLNIETSFGGIKDRSVEGAIRAVRTAIESGGKYFIKSDIRDFFTKIPRGLVLDSIKKTAADIDDEFLKLLRSAMETNLENLDELGAASDLFPTGASGVAQGSSLSPFMGNLLLKNFDSNLNCRGIHCVRFIDDFVLLGGNPSHLRKAFSSAQKMLAEFGMDAYDPVYDHEKATMGETDKGFDFLGCHVSRGWTQPSSRSRQRLIESVEETLRAALAEIRASASGKPRRASAHTHAFAQNLTELDHRIQGWREAFKFCNCPQAMEAVDRKIDILIESFCKSALDLRRGQPIYVQRCTLGVGLLAERRARTNAAA